MKKKTTEVSKMEEQLAAYGNQRYAPLVSMLGSDYIDPIDFNLSNLVYHGVSKRALQELAKKTLLTIEEVNGILHISEETLKRYTLNTLIEQKYADIAIELALLYKSGIEVLGNIKAFNNWMRFPNIALNNEVPLSLLNTSIGFDRILQVLGRLEHGVFS